MTPVNLYRLQNFAAHALLCTRRLNDINILTREELMDPDSLARLPDKTLAAEVLGYITPRSKAGRKGACIIVETPEFSGKWPDAPGQNGDIELEFLILEEPMMNSAPKTGTLVHADVIAQITLDVGKHWVVDGYGIFSTPPNAFRRDDTFGGLRAIRTRLRTSAPLGASDRVAFVSIDLTNGAVTLSSGTADAQIYWTRDGSFPGPSNSHANLYDAPFAVDSGETILAAAFRTDSDDNLSRISRILVP